VIDGINSLFMVCHSISVKLARYHNIRDSNARTNSFFIPTSYNTIRRRLQLPTWTSYLQHSTPFPGQQPGLVCYNSSVVRLGQDCEWRSSLVVAKASLVRRAWQGSPLETGNVLSRTCARVQYQCSRWRHRRLQSILGYHGKARQMSVGHAGLLGTTDHRSLIKRVS